MGLNQIMGHTFVAIESHSTCEQLWSLTLKRLLFRFCSILIGMGIGLDPIMGQAFGAKQYLALGHAMQRGWAVLYTLAVPILIMWLNTESILTGIGQHKDIAHQAGVYIRYLIPSLLVTCLRYPMRLYLKAQVRAGLRLRFVLLVSMHRSLQFQTEEGNLYLAFGVFSTYPMMLESRERLKKSRFSVCRVVRLFFC